jgi:hypothetical protein
MHYPAQPKFQTGEKGMIEKIEVGSRPLLVGGRRGTNNFKINCGSWDSNSRTSALIPC